MGAVETRCQPRLAACGEFPSLRLPAGSAWHLDGTCWEAAHVMGGLRGGASRGGPVASQGAGGQCPQSFLCSPAVKAPLAAASCCCCLRVLGGRLFPFKGESSLPHSPSLPAWLCHRSW